jgi:hypothetical protein
MKIQKTIPAGKLAPITIEGSSRALAEGKRKVHGPSAEGLANISGLKADRCKGN